MRRFLVWATMLAIMISFVFPSMAGAEPSPITMKVTAGFDGRGKVGAWIPVRVDVTNQGPEIQGEVRVIFKGDGQFASSYAVPAVLAPGAKKQFTLYVPLDMGFRRFDVNLVSAGKVAAKETATVNTGSPEDLLAGTVSDDPTGLDYIGGVRMPNPNSDLRVAHLDQDSFPASVAPMKSFDLLVLNNFDTTRLNDNQKKALQAWVEDGGFLVIGGGPNWRKTLSGLPETLKPVEGTGTRSVNDLPELGKFAGKMLPAGNNFAVTTGQLKFGRVLARDGSDPIVVLARKGEGTILYAAVDLALEPMTSWTGTMAFWQKLLTQAPSNAAAGIQGRPMPMTKGGWAMMNALQNIPAMDLPSARLMGGLLLAYILLIGPVNYLILKRLDRRDWAWVTIPVVALLFVGSVYTVGFIGKGRDVLTHTISIMELVPGSDTARTTTYVGVFAPSKNTYRINLEPGLMVRSMPFFDGPPPPGTSPEIARITQGEKTTVEFLDMNMWSMRGFIAEKEIPAPGRIEADLTVQNSRIVGTLTNKTSVTIEDAGVITGSNYQKLGNIAPGATVKVDVGMGSFNPNYGMPAFQLINPPSPGPGPYQPGPQEREMNRRRMVIEGVFGYEGFLAEKSQGSITFLGWTNEPVRTVDVSGDRRAKSQIESLTLFIARPEIKFDPKNIDIPAGIIRGRLIGIDGTGKGGIGWNPYGAYYVNGNTSLTFLVELPEIDLAAVGGISLHLNANGPGISALEMSLWNVRTGQWEKAVPSTKFDIENFRDYVAEDGSIRLILTNPSNQMGYEIFAPSVSVKGVSR